MSTVVELKDMRIKSTGEKKDPAVQYIEECYAKLGAMPGFVVREAQVGLSIDICKSLVADEPLIAEAPTGTGKTLAYLIGAHAASIVLSTTEKPVPIVIATATVGLQSQILDGDYPLLVKAGIVEQGSAVIAKGRGRYFCVSNAEKYLAANNYDSQYDIFDMAANNVVDNYTDIQDMLMLWNSKQWPGDVDLWPQGMPKGWDEIAATSESCIGYKCEHYDSCPFFKNRKSLAYAKVIVANQDLVLSDLMMNFAQIDPLFPSSKYLVVFDEAHHLPHKAVDIGAAKLDIGYILEVLPKLADVYPTIARYSKIQKATAKYALSNHSFKHEGLVAGLENLRQVLRADDYSGDIDNTRRFVDKFPETLYSQLKFVLMEASRIQQCYMDAIQGAKTINLEFNEELKKPVSDFLGHCAFANGVLKRLVNTLMILCSDNKLVRWVKVKENYCEVAASPLDGSSVLRPLLWHSDRTRSALVSATLRDFEGFDRFKEQAGLDRPAREAVLEPIFPFHLNTLQVVKMRFTPKYETRKFFGQELRMLMPEYINEKEGTLILFPSMSMMGETLPMLKEAFGDKVLVQGEMAFKDLIRTHKQRIDAKKGSILCGVATLAEGLDLPGAYCTHVIICALPFTVPTSPVELTHQELLGRGYFKKRSLPDMFVQLVQMVGRLMRRESDRGKITFFDSRLVKPYMKRVWEALPPFKRVLINPYAESESEKFIEVKLPSNRIEDQSIKT